MKLTELNLEKQGFYMSCNVRLLRSHYRSLMKLGRVFPTTKSQADYFIKNNITLDVLNMDDVILIENLMNKHGFEGNYKRTKSASWVRLKNHDDLYTALINEYSI